MFPEGVCIFRARLDHRLTPSMESSVFGGGLVEAHGLHDTGSLSFYPVLPVTLIVSRCGPVGQNLPVARGVEVA